MASESQLLCLHASTKLLWARIVLKIDGGLCVDAAAAAAAKNNLSYSLECTGVTSKCKWGNVVLHTRVLSYTSTGVEVTLPWRMYCVGRVPCRSLCQFLKPWPSEQSIAVTQRPACKYKCLQPCMCGSCARVSVIGPTINPTGTVLGSTVQDGAFQWSAVD